MINRKASDADVESVVRYITYVSQEAMLLEKTKDWSAADFAHALDRLEVEQPTSRREPLRQLYRALRVERAASDAQRVAEELDAKRHTEVLARLEALRKPHWSVAPNFWLTVAILVLTAIGVIAAVASFFSK